MDGVDYYGTTGKRSYSYDDEVPDRTSRQKRRTTSNNEPSTQFDPTSNDTEYRILCPAAKIGGVIGKGGSIIKALRQECRSKIKVEDPVPGSDERVIYICSTSRDGRDKSKDRDSEKQSLCPAQEALFGVHARIVNGDGSASDEDDDEPPQPVTARLLVPNIQIGCLLGKGGRIIEQMRKEIAAQIRVMPKEQLPLCASPTDELVQLSGDPALVKKALKAVSSRLYENPPRERSQGGSLSQGPAGVPSAGLYSSGSYLSQGGSLLAPTSVGGPMMGLGSSLPSVGGGYGGSGMGSAWSFNSGLPVTPLAGSNPVRTEGASEDELMIRLLCPNERIGSIIGKGGNVIKKMREETGAKIKVGDAVSDADERVVQISSTEFMESYTSPGIEAALQVHQRLADLQMDKDKDNDSFTARLLVPSSDIGCLLGKGGSIISEMRKITKANIRIPPKEELPKCAGEKDELVQIMGDQNVVQDALIQVLNRLRNNLFKGRDGGGLGGAMLPLSGLYSGRSMLSGYGGRHDLGSPGSMYSLTTASLHGMDYGGYGTALGAADLQPSSGRGGPKESRRRQR